MNPMLIGAGVLAAVMLAMSMSKGGASGKTVTVNGHKWLVTMSEMPDGVRHFLVMSPAGQFGPHVEMPVLSFKQNGDDVGSRVLGSKYAGVPPQVFEYALNDFSVQTAEDYFPRSDPPAELRAHVVRALHPQMVDKPYITQIRDAVNRWAQENWALREADAARVMTLLNSKLAVLA